MLIYNKQQELVDKVCRDFLADPESYFVFPRGYNDYNYRSKQWTYQKGEITITRTWRAGSYNMNTGGYFPDQSDWSVKGLSFPKHWVDKLEEQEKIKESKRALKDLQDTINNLECSS